MFQVYSKVTQLYIHIFVFRFFSIMGYYKILSIVLCAIQQVLIGCWLSILNTEGILILPVFCFSTESSGYPFCSLSTGYKPVIEFPGLAVIRLLKRPGTLACDTTFSKRYNFSYVIGVNLLSLVRGNERENICFGMNCKRTFLYSPLSDRHWRCDLGKLRSDGPFLPGN